MKIENTEVMGWRAAFRGMRNPMNSWNKSDTIYHPDLIIGPNDLDLAINLIKGGSEHRKFLRMIHIQVDLTVARNIWTEFDTYRVGVTRNSCSTMHKLGSKPLTVDDFEAQVVLPQTLFTINDLAEQYRRTKNVELLRQMKAYLPESFLQKATIDMNYECAMNMYFQRRNHRMVEWSGPEGICAWIKSLPYMSIWLTLKEQ